jgi:hypothetical protein
MKKSELTAFIKEEILGTLSESPSTEEIRMAKQAVARFMKYRSVGQNEAIRDLENALDALKQLEEVSDEEIAKTKELKTAIDDLAKAKKEAGLNEAREYDADAMEALGFDLYPGGRNEAFRYATEELGIPADEILGKISDDVIYNAIHHSLQVMDMYRIEEKVNEEEDAPAGDAEVEKKASKQDKIIKDFKNIEAKMKTHLELYKTSESSKNKEAAKNMLKKLTPEYQAAKEKYEKLKKVK